MATVTKRGQYQWQAKVRRKGHTCVSKTFVNKSDALRWARHIESDMDRGR